MLAITAGIPAGLDEHPIYSHMVREFLDLELHDTVVDLSEPEPWFRNAMYAPTHCLPTIDLKENDH